MQGSEEERQIFIQAISQSPLLRGVAQRLLAKTPPSRADLANELRELDDLSDSTALHRAATMLNWRKKLLSPQLRILREPRLRGMWRRIEIKNFRSIEHATVTLAPLTLVVGPNGSGKSNFADALVFARDVSMDASAAISSRGGISGVRRWTKSKPTDVTIDLRAASSKAGLETTYTRHLFKIHSGAQGNWNFSKEAIDIFDNGRRSEFIERDGFQISGSADALSAVNDDASVMILARQLKGFGRTSAVRNVKRYRLNPDAMRQPQLSTEETRLDESGQNIASAIRSIFKSGQIDKIIDPMCRIVPGLQNIHVEQVSRYLALKFEQQQAEGAKADFNATEMSDGALRALGIIVATHQMVRDELLIIEEPEIAVHVGAAQLLFEILKGASARGAVLLTTHSADLLDAASDEEILVCNYVEGSTRIGPLSHAQRKIVRDGLFSIAELMRAEPLRIEGDTNEGRSTRQRERRRNAG